MRIEIPKPRSVSRSPKSRHNAFIISPYLASLAATSSFLFFRSNSADTWEKIADGGSWAVIVGVVLELPELCVKIFEGTLKKWPKIEHRLKDWIIKRNLTKRFESLKRCEYWIDPLGFFAWIIIVVGLVIEVGANQRARVIQDSEFSQVSKQAAETYARAVDLESANLVMRSNVVTMEAAVRELAHLYDQSTNALAEANSRLRSAKIKTPKEVLIDCLNAIDPEMVKDLSSSNTPIKFTGRVEFFPFSELKKAAEDINVSRYIVLEGTGGGLLLDNGKVVGIVSITLDPSLLK